MDNVCDNYGIIDDLHREPGRKYYRNETSPKVF